MRPLGLAVLASLSALILATGFIPISAVLIRGAPGLARIGADPTIVQAAFASLRAGGLVMAVGWPVGVLAAFGLWGAAPAWRRTVLSGSGLAVLLAFALSGENAGKLNAASAELVLPVAAAASLVLLILTGTLNTLDPRLLQTSQALGASPARAWLAVLAALRTTLAFAAAAGFGLGLGLCGQLPGHLTLAGLLRLAVRRGDEDVAPEALLLALASLVPLALAAMLALAGGRFRRS